MKSSQIRACRRIFSVMLCAAAIVAYPFWASSQETYQKKFPIEHIVGDGPAFVVYAGQYGGNICVVVRSEIILFNPNSGSIISRSNLSISGYYLRINAVYQEGNILYCTTAYANTGTEIGCVFKFDLATNTLLWQKKLYAPIGTTPPSEFNSMTSDGNNSLYVSGSSLRGTYGHDVLLVKLHTNGDVIWAKNFGTDTSNDVSKGICYNSNRELYLSSTSQTAIGDVQSVIYRCDSAGNVICAKAISGSVTGPRMAGAFIGMVADRLCAVDKTYIGSDPGPMLVRMLDSSFTQLSDVSKQGLIPGQVFFNNRNILVAGQAPFAEGMQGFRTIRFDSGLNIVGSRYFEEIPTVSIFTSSACFISDSNISYHFFKAGATDTVIVVRADSSELVGCHDTAFSPTGYTFSYIEVPFTVVQSIIMMPDSVVSESVSESFGAMIDICPPPAQILPIDAKSVSFFPNPANEELNITYQEKINAVTIINVTGQQVLHNEYNAEEVRMNISGLPPGMYFVKINGVCVRKFVKE